MKRFILFIAIFFSFSICWSQIIVEGSYGDEPCKLGKYANIGKSSIDCIYHYTIYDPEYDDIEECYQILQINKDRSVYRNYKGFRCDSILISLGNRQLTNREFFKIFNTYGDNQTRSGYTVIVKEHAQNELKVYDKVFIDNYIYTESVPQLKWVIGTERKNICGYYCTKATCSFRGRQWTAWYTEEIPIDNGPWKFNGLPGLILHIEDSKNEHTITAIGIRNCNSDMYIEVRDYFKTSREKFNAELKNYKEDARQYIAGSHVAPKNADGSPARIPKRRLFFNPIELE